MTDSVSWLNDECLEIELGGDRQWERIYFGPYEDSLWRAYGDSDQPFLTV